MENFIAMSRYAGMREDLVQAGGGNSSFKASGHEMYIKASGYQMADVNREQGYAVVNPQQVQKEFLSAMDSGEITDARGREILARATIRGERPSIETFLHACTGRYTLHTHPIVVNALTARTGGMERLRQLFPGALMVGYATPGADLAQEYFSCLRDCPDRGGANADLIFLKNHGLIVSADTAQAVIEKNEAVLLRLEAELGVAARMRPYHTASWLARFVPEGIVWTVTDAHILEAFRARGNTLWDYAFCPDCVVFLGKKPLYLREGEEEVQIRAFREENGLLAVVVRDGNLYLLAPSVKKALEMQSVLSFSAQVDRLNDGAACDVLSDWEQNFLLNWETETYRRNFGK